MVLDGPVEARWMVKRRLTSEKQMPDFLGYIIEDGLKGAKPEAVNIIRQNEVMA